MPALRAAAAGPRALGGDGQKIRALARDLFDAAARHRTELVHTPFYGGRCVILQTSAPTRSIHAKSGRADLAGAARRYLREKFLTVPYAISGANFAIAETGSVVIFE